MDWPTTNLETLAIRDVLRGRIRRAEEVADAIASAVPEADAWRQRVLAAAGDLRASMSRDDASRLAAAWQDGAPPPVPPAEIALAPWLRPRRQPVWSPDEIQRVSARLRDERSRDPIAVRLADLADRWSRQRLREWHAAATALLRWLSTRRSEVIDVRAVPPPATQSRRGALPILIALGVLLWRRRF